MTRRSVRFVLSTVAAVIVILVMVTFSPQLTTTNITHSQISSLVSTWLRPPYLHLLINFIIVTFFASSKLHQHDYPEPTKKFPTPNNYYYECVQVSDELYGNENQGVPTTNNTVLANNLQLDTSNNANISYYVHGTKEIANFETWKLPGPVIFANTEGKEKLGVPKPGQELETLDSTWKAITNARPMQNSHKMITSETFNQQLGSNQNNISRKLAGSSSLGKLTRDPSSGQDELNKRVEAFISMFKEDMRLQRKESLRQYLEMINSGAF
ncbi:hypothetical protein POM88_045200 [Heracleum sosnowskyi]|uniref:DUF4408 domain-containing protein n=1 Tax=Heracleum sosnowskyi TaxID=360622 RepID=A0AAD8H5I0_9APIA|nr:hypothetical protein POM88_045200 [Heracleum sosnowskyi]